VKLRQRLPHRCHTVAAPMSDQRLRAPRAAAPAAAPAASNLFGDIAEFQGILDALILIGRNDEGVVDEGYMRDVAVMLMDAKREYAFRCMEERTVPSLCQDAVGTWLREWRGRAPEGFVLHCLKEMHAHYHPYIFHPDVRREVAAAIGGRLNEVAVTTEKNRRLGICLDSVRQDAASSSKEENKRRRRREKRARKREERRVLRE